MKKLLFAGSVVLTLLLGGCASIDGTHGGLAVTHPDPVTEMTKSACCLKPSTR